MDPLIRQATKYTGLSRPIARTAVALGTTFGPIIKRLAPIIFILAVAAVIAFVWAVAEFVNPRVPWIIRDIIIAAGGLGFVSVVAIVGIWGERKVAGHIQSRVGPMRTGGWHGWSQSFADGLKLVAKEDLIPTVADRPLFRLAPYVALVPAIAAYFAIPFSAEWIFRDLHERDVSLLMVLGLFGIEVLGVILAGWASNNKWGLYGAMREACQLVSYEIPMGLALLTAVTVAGSLSLKDLGQLQQGGWFHWLAFKNPFVFAAFIMYFVASLAACKRAPFDLPEGESELVAGFHTEYSGFRFAMFFFAEYAGMFIVAALGTIIFLGGWNSPFGPGASPLWFIGKCAFIIFIHMWLRWTLPRIRIDQVMHTCVKYLLPLAMALFLGAGLWHLYHRPETTFYPIAEAVRIVLGSVGLFIFAICLYLLLGGYINRTRKVGRMARKLMPGA